MRKHLAILVVLAFLLFVLGATAQTSSSSEPQQQTTTTTTTTTTQQDTSGTSDHSHGASHAKSSSQSSGGERTVEGCIVKEASEYFLIPSHGNPIELQVSAGQDISAHAGHKVKVHGTESSLGASRDTATGATGGASGTAASTSTTSTGAQSSTRSTVSEPAGASGSSPAGEASGSGNNLHRLATKQMTVVKLDHVAATCPVNWNPNVPSKSTKY